MIIHYQRADGKEIYIKNIIYIQNIDNEIIEAVCDNNHILTLRIVRIEGILNDDLIQNKGGK